MPAIIPYDSYDDGAMMIVALLSLPLMLEVGELNKKNYIMSSK